MISNKRRFNYCQWIVIIHNNFYHQLLKSFQLNGKNYKNRKNNIFQAKLIWFNNCFIIHLIQIFSFHLLMTQCLARTPHYPPNFFLCIITSLINNFGSQRFIQLTISLHFPLYFLFSMYSFTFMFFNWIWFTNWKFNLS